MGTNFNKKMFRNSHDIILEENGRGRYYSHDHTSYRRDHSRVDKVRGNSDKYDDFTTQGISPTILIDF